MQQTQQLVSVVAPHMRQSVLVVLRTRPRRTEARRESPVQHGRDGVYAERALCETVQGRPCTAAGWAVIPERAAAAGAAIVPGDAGCRSAASAEACAV